jgi:glycosyltransferase involved in cell wall biosynthesis
MSAELERADSPPLVWVAACGRYGGAESVIRRLVRGLASRGHRLRLVLLRGDDADPAPHPVAEDLAGCAEQVVSLAFPPRALLAERRRLLALYREAGSPIVHTHGYRADIQALPVARRAGLATVSTVHGFTGGGFKLRLYEALQERALRRADAIVAVSRPLVERLTHAGVDPRRIHLVPNAWGGGGPLRPRGEARRALGLAEGTFALGWVGRLSREKGADVLIEALARTADPTLQACLVGEGPERPALEALARARGVADRLHFAGFREDAPSLFAAFDALVLSSRTEGTPMVLFEAMEAGVPLVAAAVGGVPDVVDPGSGWLVPPEDPAALARALDELRADPRAARQRADTARQRLRREFREEPCLDAYERIYREVARARRT